MVGLVAMSLLNGLTGQDKFYITTLLPHHQGARHILSRHAVKQYVVKPFRQRHINTHLARFGTYQLHCINAFRHLTKRSHRFL